MPRNKRISILHLSLLLCFISLIYPNKVSGQNLVPNPSFETGYCGNQFLNSYCYWFKPKNDWGTPDVFENDSNAALNNFPCPRLVGQNTWAGNAYTPFGTRFLGMLMYYPQGGQIDSRENICTRLTDSLVEGKRYKIGFHAKFANRSQYAINHFGIKLSSDTLTCSSNHHLINETPTLESPLSLLDSTNWTTFETEYLATGGEKYLTIGNFYADSNCTILNNPLYNPTDTFCLLSRYGGYYFFDSVFVEEIKTESIASTLPDNIVIAPNPGTGGIVTIKCLGNLNLQDVKIYSIEGRLLNYKFERVDNSKILLRLDSDYKGIVLIAIRQTERTFYKTLLMQ